MANEQVEEVEEISVDKLRSLLSVPELARQLGVPAGVVRRAAKKGEIPGTVTVLDRTGFDPELALNWEAPEGRRQTRSSRDDGRLRYTIWLTDEEAEELDDDYDLEDPRAKAKLRRQARKAKKAAEKGDVEDVEDVEDDNGEEEDPFADFSA